MLSSLIYNLKRQNILKIFLWTVIIFVLFYTRFYGLDWGMPYWMHPDERNMMIAVLHFNCHNLLKPDCLNPDFFAYGQLPLYLSYAITLILNWLFRLSAVSNETVTLSLRLVSASASIGTFIIFLKTLRLFFPKRDLASIIASLIVIFTPAFIQFAHFGTTESLLIFFITCLIYVCFLYLNRRIASKKYVLLCGIIIGASVATKISGISFAVLPVLVFLFSLKKENFYDQFIKHGIFLVKIALISILFSIFFSPYNLIDFPSFISSISYESSVGVGISKAFYTRQFEYSLPFIFPIIKIWPYAMGLPISVLFVLGFFTLPFKKKENVLRLAFILLIIPSAYLYAKWTRFFAPTFPLMAFIASLTASHLMFMILDKFRFMKKIPAYILLFLAIILILIPGAALFSVYKSPDVRFVASKWIYENIPPNSKILSETANVADIPMPSRLYSQNDRLIPNINPISFDFYETDNNPGLEKELAKNIEIADYIFVPSRRIFANHSCQQILSVNTPASGQTSNLINLLNSIPVFEKERCKELKKVYPVLNAYYEALISGKLGFEKVAEFTSYPKIQVFGRTLIEFPDEQAEETWTVFDHPVIRIYKRVN